MLSVGGVDCRGRLCTRKSPSQPYVVLPSLIDIGTTGPFVREAQRHLAQWGLAPVAALMAQECSDKLGDPVTIDVM